MINFNDQYCFLECLRPPVGYSFEYCLGTTYSLDIECVVASACSAVLGRVPTTERRPDEVLHAISEFTSRSLILCQSCRIHDTVDQNATGLGSGYQSLVKYFDQCIYAIPTSSANSSFHPKVWLLKFHCEDDHRAPVFRLLVTSRNLTRATNWEIGAIFEGSVGSAPHELTEGLKDFLADLQTELPKGKRDFLKRVRSEIKRIAFRDIDGTGTPEFLFQSPRKSSTNQILQEQYDKLIVVSPFLSERTVKTLSEHAAELTLITSPDGVTKLKNLSPAIQKRTYVMGPSPKDEGKWLDDVEALPLHAKFYIGLKNDQCSVTLGSANCTENALRGHNTEAVVRLHGSKVLFHSFWRNLVFVNKTVPHPWLQPYESFLNQCSIPKEAEHEVYFDLVRNYLSSGLFEIHYSRAKKTATIHFSASQERRLPPQVKISIQLLGTEWGKFASSLTSKGLIFRRFDTIPSEFVRVRLSFKSKKCSFLTLASSNLNRDARNGRIFRGIMPRGDDFFRFLDLLLGDKETGQSGAGGIPKELALKRRLRNQVTPQLEILEKVLLKASNSDAVVESINRHLREVKKTTPKLRAFKAFWKQFYGMRQEIKKSNRKVA